MEPSLEEALRNFLKEDLGYGDITSEALIPEGLEAEAVIMAKEEGIIAGLKEAARLFALLGCEAIAKVREGSRVEPGQEVMLIRGKARALLMGERVALNLLSRMSGIATATKRMVERVARVSSTIRVAATRKTAPGLMAFDKRAVALGGGDPHRFRLDDCALIKDNHLALVGSLEEALSLIRAEISFTKKVEVEVRSLEEAIRAARAGADIILLDNMPPEEVKEVVEALKREGLRDKVLLEASGGIDEGNAEDYARAGVDIISSGAITHSAKALNLSLEVVRRL